MPKQGGIPLKQENKRQVEQSRKNTWNGSFTRISGYDKLAFLVSLHGNNIITYTDYLFIARGEFA